MQLLLIDSNQKSIEALEARVSEAIKQSAIRRVRVETCSAKKINSLNTGLQPNAVILGPGCYDEAEQLVDRMVTQFTEANLAIVLQNDVYAVEAVRLRRLSGVRVIPIADIANLAHFLLDSYEESRRSSGQEGDGVIGVAQLKGGVGSSTLAASIASCRATHGDSVVIVDLDDINPQITNWARVGIGKRTAVAELLKNGSVPAYRLAEAIYQVERDEGTISVVGQPEHYHESFHFKADVIDGAPSSQAFIESLLPQLRQQFDSVIIDFGRSWGVAHFASLPLCQQVALVVDDDAMSLRMTIDSLRRLSHESEDSSEFDFSKWRVVFKCLYR